jgi:hypothetical protein
MKIDSRPVIDETPASPHPELLDQGFISNSVAPAEPALSSFPALILTNEVSIIDRNIDLIILVLTFI